MNSRNPANRFIYTTGPKPVYLVGPDGQRLFRTVRDKLGDIIRVYRALWK